MADARRLIELGMVPELAAEVASQIAASVAAADAAVTTLAPVIAAVEDPATYSEVAADLSVALVAAGLMEAEA